MNRVVQFRIYKDHSNIQHPSINFNVLGFKCNKMFNLYKFSTLRLFESQRLQAFSRTAALEMSVAVVDSHIVTESMIIAI